MVTQDLSVIVVVRIEQLQKIYINQRGNLRIPPSSFHPSMVNDDGSIPSDGFYCINVH